MASKIKTYVIIGFKLKVMLCLLIMSTNNLCKHFGPRPGPTFSNGILERKFQTKSSVLKKIINKISR